MNRHIREDRETNMDLIKDVAKALLFQEVLPCEQFGFVVYHPFTNSNTVAVRNNKTGEFEIVDILHDAKGKRQWMNDMIYRIDACETPWEILCLMNKPYYFAFIKFAHDMMSNKDLGMILSHAWVSVEYSNNDTNLRPDEIVNLMSCLPKELLMTEEDLHVYNGLLDKFTVFRGVNPQNVKYVDCALSWTLDIEIAKFFANRFNSDGSGKVYGKVIDKSDVLAYFNTRNEQEEVIIPKGTSSLYVLSLGQRNQNNA